MIFGSLFAGIGGFDLGLERAGMTCAWQVEIDRFCRRVLAKHWPNVERHEDVRHVGKHNLRSVDLVCGGFPCQPHSVAGQRKGAADDRDLWPEMRRVVDELRPRWVLAENVVGIRTTILDAVLLDLENLGYIAWPIVIPAAGVGAPHQRDRIWIVAHDDRTGRAWPRTDSAESNTGADGRHDTSGICATLAIADGHRGALGLSAPGHQQRTKTAEPDHSYHGFDASQSQSARLQARRQSSTWWSTEPDVGRVAYGVPNRVDRLRSLGNAVVPQVVELIGRAIIEADAS